jgi:hypothetical protein
MSSENRRSAGTMTLVMQGEYRSVDRQREPAIDVSAALLHRRNVDRRRIVHQVIIAIRNVHERRVGFKICGSKWQNFRFRRIEQQISQRNVARR